MEVLRFGHGQLIRGGQVASYAELAELGHVSRARVSQIMNLLLLAPDLIAPANASSHMSE